MQSIGASLVLCCLIAIASHGQVSAFYGERTRPIRAVKAFFYPHQWKLPLHATGTGALLNMEEDVATTRADKLFIGLGMIVDRVENQTYMLMDEDIYIQHVYIKNYRFSPVNRNPAPPEIELDKLPADFFGIHDYRLEPLSDLVSGSKLRTYGILLDFWPINRPDGDEFPLAREEANYGHNCYLYGYGLDEKEHSERSFEHFYKYNTRVFVRVPLRDPHRESCHAPEWPHRCTLPLKDRNNLICVEAAAGAPVMCGNPPKLTYVVEYHSRESTKCLRYVDAWRVAPVIDFMKLPNIHPKSNSATSNCMNGTSEYDNEYNDDYYIGG